MRRAPSDARNDCVQLVLYEHDDYLVGPELNDVQRLEADVQYYGAVVAAAMRTRCVHVTEAVMRRYVRWWGVSIQINTYFYDQTSYFGLRHSEKAVE